MTDIVERLRTAASNNRIQAERGTTATGEILTALGCQTKEAVASMHDEAADEIERLRKERSELLEALEAFAKHFGPLHDNEWLNDECRRCFSLARAALSKAEGGANE